MPNKRDYTIGYGRPPKDTQFRKGQSGNPSGRRGWSPSFVVQLDKALKKRVKVKINGRTRRITRQELIVEQTVNRAASGDRGYVKLLFTLTLANADGLDLWRDNDGSLGIPLEVLRELMSRAGDDDNNTGND